MIGHAEPPVGKSASNPFHRRGWSNSSAMNMLLEFTQSRSMTFTVIAWTRYGVKHDEVEKRYSMSETSLRSITHAIDNDMTNHALMTHDERLPRGTAALVLLAMSCGLWLAIGYTAYHLLTG